MKNIKNKKEINVARCNKVKNKDSNKFTDKTKKERVKNPKRVPITILIVFLVLDVFLFAYYITYAKAKEENLTLVEYLSRNNKKNQSVVNNHDFPDYNPLDDDQENNNTINNDNSGNNSSVDNNGNDNNGNNPSIKPDDNDNPIVNPYEDIKNHELYEKKISLKIGDSEYHVDWLDNRTIIDLKGIINDGLVINLKPFKGTGSVGDLNHYLVNNDEDIYVNYGDIVLYEGNKIVIFYQADEGKYTKLGHVAIARYEILDLLTEDDVVVTLNIED